MEEKSELLLALSSQVNGMWDLFFDLFRSKEIPYDREKLLQDFMKCNNEAHILMSKLATALEKAEKKPYRLFRL